MRAFAQAPATLLFDDRVRVYFSTRPDPDTAGQYVSLGGYVDLRRDNLFDVVAVSPHPVMTLGGRGAFDEFGTYPMTVARDGDTWHITLGDSDQDR